MNDLRKWDGMLGQGETFALIPNMMYVSREEGTQANTRQRKPEKQGNATIQSGMIVLRSTMLLCQVADWPWPKSFTLRGWTCFEVGSSGVILDLNIGGMGSIKDVRVRGFEGVSSERLLT